MRDLGTHGCSVSLCYGETIDDLLSLIPSQPDDKHKLLPNSFQRNRKLPFKSLVSFVLSSVTSDKESGIDILLSEFFEKISEPSQLPPERSAVTKARSKVSWEAFREIFHKITDKILKTETDNDANRWNGYRLIAIDGSKHTLPSSEEIRATFNPKSGLDYPGKGHYPQCLVSVAFDVLKRLPLGMCVNDIKSSERKDAVSLIKRLPADAIYILDRGYPGYELVHFLHKEHAGKFLIRCQAKNSFGPVTEFLNSGNKETIVELNPSKHFFKKLSADERNNYPPITVRIIRYETGNGSVSALITNLLDTKRFSLLRIVELYRLRWGVETHYRDNKCSLKIEKFHSKSVNGVLQEFYALAIMAVIAQVLTSGSLKNKETEKHLIVPQFKNSIKTLGRYIYDLLNNKSRILILNLISKMSYVKYYQLKQKRASQPRVSKAAPNKWATKARLKSPVI